MIEIIATLLFIWVVCTTALRLIWLIITAFTKENIKDGCIKIKLLKSSKMKKSKTPIYKLIEGNEYSKAGFYIQKYEHAWLNSFLSDLMFFFVPLPIMLLVYRYTFTGSVYINEDMNTTEEIESWNAVKMEEYFERMAESKYRLINVENAIKKTKKEAIDKANEEFNANYIK